MKKEFKQVGKQIVLELFGVEADLSNIKSVEEKIINIAQKINATIISSNFLHFNPYGISGVLIIAESHIAVHTWEEYKYVAVDMFSCDLNLDLDLAVKLFVKEFKAKGYKKETLKRGVLL